METKGIHRDENALGFDDDPTGKVTPNTPGITVHGPHTMTFHRSMSGIGIVMMGAAVRRIACSPLARTPAAAPGGSYT
jgi:hypothetical protein